MTSAVAQDDTGLPDEFKDGLTAAQLLAEGGPDTGAYVQGALYMLAYELLRTGNRDKAICVTDAFYRSPEKQMTRRVWNAFDEFPDYPPGHIIFVLADAECNLSDQTP